MPRADLRSKAAGVQCLSGYGQQREGDERPQPPDILPCRRDHVVTRERGLSPGHPAWMQAQEKVSIVEPSVNIPVP